MGHLWAGVPGKRWGQDAEDSVALTAGRASNGKNWDLKTTMWPRLQPLKKKHLTDISPMNTLLVE